MKIFESYPNIDPFLKLDDGTKFAYRPVQCSKCKIWVGIEKQDEVLYLGHGGFMGHKDLVKNIALKIRCPNCRTEIKFTIQEGLDYF